MKSVERIRLIIEEQGGVKSFPQCIRKHGVTGCPSKRMICEELKALERPEIQIAFHLGLIGNNNKIGTIVKNATKHSNFNKQNNVGRPPLPDNERKKNRGFKCSDLVWDKIGVLAEKHGISKNEFLEYKALS